MEQLARIHATKWSQDSHKSKVPVGRHIYSWVVYGCVGNGFGTVFRKLGLDRRRIARYSGEGAEHGAGVCASRGQRRYDSGRTTRLYLFVQNATREENCRWPIPRAV